MLFETEIVSGAEKAFWSVFYSTALTTASRANGICRAIWASKWTERDRAIILADVTRPVTGSLRIFPNVTREPLRSLLHDVLR